MLTAFALVAAGFAVAKLIEELGGKNPPAAPVPRGPVPSGPRPPSSSPGRPATPAKVPWPTQDLGQRAAEEQKRHDALQARLDADAQEAVNKAKARNDQEALAAIARAKREKQKALDDMQEDIRRAQAASKGSA